VHGGAAVAALARGDAEHHPVDEAGHRNLTPDTCCSMLLKAVGS
jgi:hypothetical protein